MPRKIRTVGSDGAFDALMLQGKDIANGTDIRVEPGSSMGKSKAAQEAKIMDMFATGIIQDPSMALRLLEVGGVQKVQDTLATAEKKAQRENMKMKMLKPQDIAAATQEHQGLVLQGLQEDPEGAQMLADPAVQQQLQQLPPPALVKVDDFDVHEIHIETHNRFRMGQEYETLPEEVKQQFELHVQEHQQYLQQQQAAMMPAPGDPTAPGGDPTAPGAPAEAPVEGGPSMSANGAVPAPDTSTGE
jgi:hypothetical protein